MKQASSSVCPGATRVLKLEARVVKTVLDQPAVTILKPTHHNPAFMKIDTHIKLLY